MTIFVILFLVLFLILIFQIIRLISFAIKKKELSKEVKKTCVVFLCNVFAFILVGVTAPENIKNKAKESGIKKKAEKVKEVKKKVDKEKKQVVTDKKKVENKTSVESIKPSNEVRVTKNKENGDFVLQIIVPENATEEEISRILMDTAVANKKRFQGDNIMVVAYSDEHYMYKSLLGTHGQMRLINGGTDFIKISPKENINAEDKKDFKEYFDLYQGFKDFGDDDETARKETQTMLCGRNKERCKEIIKKSEKYFFDINNK